MSENGETNAEDVANLSLNEESPHQHSDDFDDDDEFGEFGEFDGVEDEPADPTNELNGEIESGHTPDVDPDELLPPKNEAGSGNVSDSEPIDGDVKVMKSTEISKMSFEEIQQMLTPPPLTDEAAHDEYILANDSTATSKELWQHLTETNWIPLPKWEGSAIHRQLILQLGIPLNLDSIKSPEASNAMRSLHLPTPRHKDEVEGIENLPLWEVSMASEEALNSMNSEELNAHIAKLEGILEEANTLRDALESQKMDLHGESKILNGMVDSWIMYFHSRHKNSMKKTKLKKDDKRKPLKEDLRK